MDWLSDETIEQAKRIYLGVANGTKSEALLYNNIMYALSASRPLVSVGKLKAMLDLRFVWSDGPPTLLLCFSGQKYALIKGLAKVFHHIPIIAQEEERKALVDAIEDFTITGNQRSYPEWKQGLGRDFEVFGDALHQDHPQTVGEEEGEMLHTSQKGLEKQNITPAKSLKAEITSLSPVTGLAKCR